ncbi:hypothetical protein ACFQMA_04125 [Halosimplex aquaticum]|uniref:Uncharacterized protein n=1 Tax=Halosimplex aquaticum TaxID=3026162 RepID=A0ABD5XZI2_9EURY|nr:hypothetical protein [Halosimplex aquaticum]
MGRRTRRSWLAGAALASLVAVAARPVLAHGGSLGGAARESLTVPTWLMLATGGAIVGASFLLASFATDRSAVDAVIERRRTVALPAPAALRWGAGALGVVALVGVVVTGFVGPSDPLSNPAVVIVWAGWWAGFAMSTYLVGNAWPAVNPWRTAVAALPDLGRTYRWRFGAWPSVAGLLALVWIEVVSPLADEPRVLAVTVVGYSVVTVAGAVVYGTETWFDEVDPVARVFRYYGAVAPLGRDRDGSLSLRLPGAALASDLLDGVDDAAFVVAILWVTTFDGFVATPAWRDLARGLVGFGYPPELLYPGAMLAGFALFFGVYLLAARLARRTAPTYVASETLARRFAPPLLAIAAGYHVAHFLGYFLSLIPALFAAVVAPFATVNPGLIVVPGWFGGVAIAGVLGGHLLAILAAHATAFDLFPGRLQAIRSQYPFIAVMIGYTMASLWIVTRPDVPLPYIP